MPMRGRASSVGPRDGDSSDRTHGHLPPPRRFAKRLMERTPDTPGVVIDPLRERLRLGGWLGRHDGIGRRPPRQNVADSLAGETGHSGPRLNGGTTDMREQCRRGALSGRGFTFGSPSKTSRPAAKIRRTRVHRPALSRRPPCPCRVDEDRCGFMSSSSAAPMRWRVESVSGTCKLTMSERSRISCNEGTKPRKPVSFRAVWMTSMSKPSALCATAGPMRP